MPVALSKPEAERRLKLLRRQRDRQKATMGDLATDIRNTVRAAQDVMPAAEIARLLGIDRSTLYRTYLDG